MTMTKAFILPMLVVQLVVAQHSPNSLQEAIEALHRHHEILSSQHQEHQPHHQDEDYFADDTPGDYPYGANPQGPQLNRALADYLIREEERERIPSRFAGADFDDDEMDEEFEARKRSIFRERGEKPSYKSVFRERDQYPAQTDLGQEFLQEMERERMEEEEQQYRQTLHRLWDKFHQQENSIERQLFEEQLENPDVEAEEEQERKRKRTFDLDDRRKRYGFLPMYFGPMPVKRRDYPLLPWLVNDEDDARKKRFMVRKRSAKPMAAEEPKASGTNEKVAKDLQSLFGAAVPEEKKKRSTEEAVAVAETKAAEVPHKMEKKSAHGYEDPEEEGEEEDDHEHEDHDHDHETEDVHDHDHDDSSEESDDEEQKKKKRDVSVKSAPEVVKDEQIIPGDLSDFAKKKDSGWERYFGYDRRKKKSVHWAGNGKYDSMMRQPHHGHEAAEESAQEGDEKRKKKQMDPEKLDSMDEKLKNIEDLIIEETVKYTGAHEGVSRPEQIQQLKDHVISRLATAYSLEKMRRALDQLRDNVDTERHLLHNEIEHSRDHGKGAVGDAGEDDEGSDSDDDDDDDKKKKRKRVAVKKDQTEKEMVVGGHRHPSHLKLAAAEDNDDNDDKKKKHRKRSGFNNARECPVLNAMEERCRDGSVVGFHEQLMPVCVAHELCYLCGFSHARCDLEYLADYNQVCGPNEECKLAAHSAALQMASGRSHHRRLGPLLCSQDPCLSSAIGYFTK